MSRLFAALLALTLFVAAAPLTAEQDHQRLLDLLNIKDLRPGVDGRDPNAPNAANYDDAKANPSPDLPDPLKRNDGTRVASADAWWRQRRPEIAGDFEREIYGRVPDGVPLRHGASRTARPRPSAAFPPSPGMLSGIWRARKATPSTSF